MIFTRRTAKLRYGGLGLSDHSDEMRVQYEGLIGLARPSTLSLQARLLPGSFPLTFVLTARTDLEEKGPEPVAPALALVALVRSTAILQRPDTRRCPPCSL